MLMMGMYVLMAMDGFVILKLTFGVGVCTERDALHAQLDVDHRAVNVQLGRPAQHLWETCFSNQCFWLAGRLTCLGANRSLHAVAGEDNLC